MQARPHGFTGVVALVNAQAGEERLLLVRSVVPTSDGKEFVLCDSAGDLLAVAELDTKGSVLRPKIVLMPE